MPLSAALVKYCYCSRRSVFFERAARVPCPPAPDSADAERKNLVHPGCLAIGGRMLSAFYDPLYALYCVPFRSTPSRRPARTPSISSLRFSAAESFLFLPLAASFALHLFMRRLAWFPFLLGCCCISSMVIGLVVLFG